MKQINLILLLMMITISAKSQNKIGVEIRTSQNITYNTSNFIGGSSLFSSYEITEEGNPNTTSYSVGVIYKPNLSTSFRLHIGKHQNGRILDLTTTTCSNYDEHTSSDEEDLILVHQDLGIVFIHQYWGERVELKYHPKLSQVELNTLKKMIQADQTFYKIWNSCIWN